MVCALVPVHELFITIRSKYRKLKKARNSEPSAIAMTSRLRMDVILNSPETNVSVALDGGGAY